MQHAGTKRTHEQIETNEPTNTRTPTTPSASTTAAPNSNLSATALNHPPIRRPREVEEISDEEEDEEESNDDDSEESEYVIVSIPASLVNQLRETGRSIEIRDLDSAQPSFHTLYSLPTVSYIAPSNEESKQQSPSPPPLCPPTDTRFVGSYEHSVGTNLLWKIRYDDATTVASASTNLGRASPGTNSPLLQSISGASHFRSQPSPAASVAARSGPHIDVEGKTWKRLVFARHR